MISHWWWSASGSQQVEPAKARHTAFVQKARLVQGTGRINGGSLTSRSDGLMLTPSIVFVLTVRALESLQESKAPPIFVDQRFPLNRSHPAPPSRNSTSCSRQSPSESRSSSNSDVTLCTLSPRQHHGDCRQAPFTPDRRIHAPAGGCNRCGCRFQSQLSALFQSGLQQSAGCRVVFCRCYLDAGGHGGG